MEHKNKSSPSSTEENKKKRSMFSFEVSNHLDNRKLILSGKINAPILDVDKCKVLILLSIEIQKIKIE
jgi:hypothetical protein